MALGVFCTLSMLMILAPRAFATECGGVETSVIECENGSNGVWTMLTIILNVLTAGVGVLGVLGIIIAGLQYSASAGDPMMMAKAKKRIVEVVIGLATYGVMYVVVLWLIPGGITIQSVEVDGVTVGLADSTIYLGTSTRAVAIVSPVNANDTSVTWSSSNESVAAVDKSGGVSAKSVGSATITATTKNGLTASATVMVEKKENKKSGGGNSGTISGDGSYYTPDQMSELVALYNSLGDQDYEELKQYAMSTYGMTENSFIGMVAWARIENYEQYRGGNDPDSIYLSYLCNSVGLNNAKSNDNYAQFLVNHADAWGDTKHETYYRAFTYGGSGTAPNGPYQSNLKSVRLALEHPYPNVTNCQGVDSAVNPVFEWTSDDGVKVWVW